MKSFKNIIFIFIGLILFTSSFFSCKDKKEEEATPEVSFDKSGMLDNIGNNLILPSYLKLKISIESMQLTADLFLTNPTVGSLSDLQTAFLQAYSDYQWCSTFEFGPADSEIIRANFNTFPCDTNQINSKILAGDLS